MAVSGANFAVADSGTLVVVESEGNGRMCLTLPEVLVTVVGIEKLVPTWADLDVFLRLLPRCSTGERMNPYTSTWSGVTPGDGPQEVHVVLLDNGRTRALADEVGRQALRCIRCSACLNSCPVYERVGGHAYGSVYPGPIGAILNPLLKGVGTDPQVDSLPYASTLCGACADVCPVAIDIPGILVHLRTQVVDAHRADTVPKAEASPCAPPPGAWPMPAGCASASAPPASPAASAVVAGMPGGRRALSWLPWPGSRWTQARDLPLPPAESFRAWWRRVGRDEVQAMTARDECSPRCAPSAPDAHRATTRRGRLTGIGAARPPRRTGQPADRAAMLDLFAERVADYRATVTRCAAAELAATVTAALDGSRSVVVPPGLDLDVTGALVDDGLTHADLDAVDAVVTRAVVGIARPAPSCSTTGRGRAAGSSPCCPTCTSASCTRTRSCPTCPTPSPALDPHRPQTWISGPSATSDIELSRVEGVHGPRRLHVLLVGN